MLVGHHKRQTGSFVEIRMWKRVGYEQGVIGLESRNRNFLGIYMEHSLAC